MGVEEATEGNGKLAAARQATAEAPGEAPRIYFVRLAHALQELAVATGLSGFRESTWRYAKLKAERIGRPAHSVEDRQVSKRTRSSA